MRVESERLSGAERILDGPPEGFLPNEISRTQIFGVDRPTVHWRNDGLSVPPSVSHLRLESVASPLNILLPTVSSSWKSLRFPWA
jgi:hypothetical protein